MWEFDLPHQLSVLHAISPVFPTALRMQITGEVEWWRIQGQDEQWRPRVLSGRGVSLRTLLRNSLGGSSDLRVQDLEGCFAALFDPTSIDHQYYLQELRASAAENSDTGSEF
jgi:hypothetical protein